jgi:hypothetical protein
MNGDEYPFFRLILNTTRSLIMPGRNVSLAMASVALFGFGQVTVPAQEGRAPNSKPPAIRVSLPVQRGFFNGQAAFYITPEVGVDPSGAPASVIAAAKQLAVSFNANYIPQNLATLPNSPAVDDIFSFTNFTQGNVLASAPHPAGPNNTDTNYSPLWQVSLVTWNPGNKPRELTSQQQILDAQSDGQVTVEKTPIIVECSVIFTPSGGQLPNSRLFPDRDPDVGRK